VSWNSVLAAAEAGEKPSPFVKEKARF